MNKKILTILPTILLSLLSCNRAAENKKEQIVLEAITSGRWVIQQFTNSGSDVSGKFNGYEFQFLKQGSVEAYSADNKETGTWKGNVNEMTITSDFNTTNDTLQLLNEVWIINENSWDYVKASTENNGGKTLYLKKKS